MNGTVIVPQSVEEIKTAVDNGHSVFHHNSSYQVIKDTIGQYLITRGDWAIGLTWRDGKTLNGKLNDFVIVELKENN